MTEHSAQNDLWYYWIQKQVTLISPCSQVFGWESDLVVITRSLFAHEVEIKLSRSDFKRDSEKEKFEHFRMWQEGKREYEKNHTGWRAPWKYKVLQPPNYFWYACPKDMIKPDEVPDFAGLLYLDSVRHEQKKPKRLHTEPLTANHVLQVCRSMGWRYWEMRRNKTETVERVDQ